MPSVFAAARAFSALRDAIATTGVSGLACIAGITARVAMLAAPRTPQRTGAASATQRLPVTAIVRSARMSAELAPTRIRTVSSSTTQA